MFSALSIVFMNQQVLLIGQISIEILNLLHPVLSVLFLVRSRQDRLVLRRDTDINSVSTFLPLMRKRLHLTLVMLYTNRGGRCFYLFSQCVFKPKQRND